MLDALRPDSDAGRLYALLVAHPRSSAAGIARAAHLDIEVTRAVLSDLAAAGFVHGHATNGSERLWEAEPPDGPLAAAIDGRQRELDQARERNRRLAQTFWLARRGAASYPGLEVLRERSVVLDSYRELMTSATRDIRALDRPPYLTRPEDDDIEERLATEADRIRSGIVQRTIYHGGVFAGDPYIADAAMRSIASGEQARILADVPMKLVIADDQRALLPLDPSGLADGASLVVYPSRLLTALIETFEVLWRIATPIGSVPAAASFLAADQLTILTLLSAGATDDTIARRLGVSSRTVARQCADLFARLGVTTRFQAGARAVQLGLLPGDDTRVQP